jgi:hypothetical protein
VIRACPDIPHHTHKEARDPISHKYLPFTYPFGISDIKVLSINQKLIKIWKKKHYSN